MEVLGKAGEKSNGKVWIENHPIDGWAPGAVDSVDNSGTYLVVDEHGEQFKVTADKARPVDQACLRGVEDLLSLGDFNEGALLHNVRVRYFRDEIYTGIGGPILISVNPFQNLSSLYSESKRKFYRDRAAAAGGGDIQVPPHLFSVGAAAHTAMLSETKNQSIIISGESGAGKTEATKRILAYFANLQRGSSSEGGSGGMSIEDQVLRSNPILEAFGNAKTVRNDNSSRFGKYIDIEFDSSGRLQSAKISNYLLEKVRIVKQQPEERGYHAFYQLCAGAERAGLNSMLHLHDASSHAYCAGWTEIPGVDDASEFQEMVECMDSLGFSTDEKNSIFKITAAVLHLGDMQYCMQDGQESCQIQDPGLSNKICTMLGLQEKDLAKVFQFKTLEDPFTKKAIDMPQDEVGASNTRHSMAKCLYSRLFDWLIGRINQSTMAKGTGSKTHKIGILDIYGFEVFEWNSFEQLCINFANEKLQQHFNSHMFTLEQQLYTEEGISWSHITWQDNREIIDALEKRPAGLFCIVDSECLMPNAKDEGCLNKIHATFATSKIIYKPSRFASTNFAVAHYAGEVIYDIISFLEKNTDKLHADIINLFKTSKVALLKTLFTDPRFAPELSAGGGAAAKARPAAASSRGGAGSERAKQNVTVGMVFRQQLDQLVEDLNKTNPRYIRCIKPNGEKEAHNFDSIDVRRQLRCAGMLESIRIRRAGYSVRRPFKEFYNRFRLLCPSVCGLGGRVDPDYKDLSRKILMEVEARFSQEKQGLEAKSWQVGRSKVFLKEDLQGRLEQAVQEAVKSYVVLLQRSWRGFVQRRRFRKIRKAARVVQATLLTAQASKDFRALRRRNLSALMLQKWWRMIPLRVRFNKLKQACLRIQRHYRGYACRQRVGKLKGKMAADRIQKLRDEEARKAQFEEAKRVAAEKEKALEDMRRQLEQQKLDAEAEAKRQIEAAKKEREAVAAKAQEKKKEEEKEAEQSKDLTRNPPAPKEDAISVGASPQEVVGLRQANEQLQKAGNKSEQVDKMKKEMLELRKQNARLEGLLEGRGKEDQADPETEAMMQELRVSLQEARREKVKLEVELATAKSAEEFDALNSELVSLREDLSSLRREKIETGLQLEQQSAQIEALKEKASLAEHSAMEVDALTSLNDDLQVQLQKLQAQKTALEERSTADESAKTELRELRREKMRLEGELETSKMKEAALSERLQGQDGRLTDLQQAKQRSVTVESELEVSRKQIASLREEIDRLTKDPARASSIDQLRRELMDRFETKPRLSVGPMDAGDFAESGLGERKTLLDQRAMFDQIRAQFQQANVAESQPEELSANAEALEAAAANEVLLQEEKRQLQKEIAGLQIQLHSLQDEMDGKRDESNRLIESNGYLQAEVEDLKMQLEHALSAEDRQETALISLQQKIADLEEDKKAADDRARSAGNELSALEQQVDQIRAQAATAVAAKEAMLAQIESQKAVAEQNQLAAEQSERERLQAEATLRWMESENERLRAEVSNTQKERDKIKQVVEDLMKAEQENKTAELEQEVKKYKALAQRYEREYNNSKQLNQEMTKYMAQMTQAVVDQKDEKGDATNQNRLLQKQLDAKVQELRASKMERDEALRQLDTLQSTGSYYQEKYREAQEEARRLRQEHSVTAASSSKLKIRVETLQKEVEDLKLQNGRLQHQARSLGDDSSKLDQYSNHVRDLERKLARQEEDLEKSKALTEKSQAVNDCLNHLLLIESQQSELYESTFPVVEDRALATQVEAKKSQAKKVMSRLHQLMLEEERPSIDFMDSRYR